MKKTALVLLITLTVIKLTAQEKKHSVSIYGQQSFIGGSLEFDYSFTTGENNKVYAGIRHRSFDVMKVTDSKEYMFKDRFHPFETLQEFGLILGDEYTFNIPNSKLRPFLFYNLQIAYMGIHNEFMEPFGVTEDGYQIYINTVYDADSMFVFENNIGIGGKVKLYKNFDLAFRIGMGVAVINLTDKEYRVPAGTYFKYSNIGSLGLSYNF